MKKNNILKIKAIVQETPTVKLFQFPLGTLEYEPGQYITLLIGSGDSMISRSYSLIPHKTFNEVCIKMINGKMTSQLNELKKGAKLKFMGPFGNLSLKSIEKDLVFVATGTGIAPLRAMIDQAFNKGIKKKVHLIFGERSEEEIIYRKYFEGLEKKYKNFKYTIVLSRPSEKWKGEKGHVEIFLKKEYEKTKTPNKKKQLYLCGILEMVEDVKSLALKLGFEEENIFYEKY